MFWDISLFHSLFHTDRWPVGLYWLALALLPFAKVLFLAWEGHMRQPYILCICLF